LGLEDHAGVRLAPRMVSSVIADAVLRMVGTMIDFCKRRPFARETLAHPDCQGFKSLLVKKAAPNSCLVGYHDDRPIKLVDGKTHKIKNSGQEFEFIDPMHIAMIDIDNTISIQEQRRTWFLARHAVLRVFDTATTPFRLPVSGTGLTEIWKPLAKAGDEPDQETRPIPIMVRFHDPIECYLLRMTWQDLNSVLSTSLGHTT